MLTLFLFACTTKDLPPPPSAADDDTGTLDVTGTDSDTGASPGETGDPTETAPPDETATGTETGETGDALPALTGECVAPTELADDPLVVTGAYGTPAAKEIEFELISVDRSVDGAYVYASGQGGVQIFGIEGGISKVGTYSGPRNYWFDVTTLSSSLVAVSHWEYGVELVMVNNPSTPNSVAALDVPSASRTVGDGDTLYALSFEGAVMAFDISTPSSPAERWTLEGLGSPRGMALTEDYAYLADSQLGLLTLSRPENERDPMAVVHTVPDTGGVLDLVIDGEHLYVAGGSSGLLIYSLAEPAAPSLVAALSLNRSVLSVSVLDGIAWVAAYEDIIAIDVSDPAAPQALAAEPTNERAMAVLAVEGGAYAAAWMELVGFALDTSSPSPEIDPGQDTLYIDPDGGVTEALIYNRGSSELVISGGGVEDARFTVAAETHIAPGEAGLVSLNFDGGEGATTAQLCLATNDPDESVFEWPIATSESASIYGAIGQPAPDFELVDVSGELHRLSDYLGSPIFITWFATW